MKTGLDHISVNKEIAGRYYQEEAIKEYVKALAKESQKSIVGNGYWKW